jgi:hypothetical protein
MVWHNSEQRMASAARDQSMPMRWGLDRWTVLGRVVEPLVGKIRNRPMVVWKKRNSFLIFKPFCYFKPI